MSESTQPEVLRLVERCLDLLDGSPPAGGDSGPGRVDALLAEHPEHEAAVRERLAWLSRLGMLGGDDEGKGEDIPERVGEFRILERLGVGGMGVVYRARQEGLEREVAVKMVRASELYFPGARERFRREVESIARLDHPAIVSIHVVGEEKGVPYFAMEYVSGLGWTGSSASSEAGRRSASPARTSGRPSSGRAPPIPDRPRPSPGPGSTPASACCSPLRKPWPTPTNAESCTGTSSPRT